MKKCICVFFVLSVILLGCELPSEGIYNAETGGEEEFVPEIPAAEDIVPQDIPGPVQCHCLPVGCVSLYGHDNTNHTIIRIDTSTGTATVVGSTTFNSGSSGLTTSFWFVKGPEGKWYLPGTIFGLLRDDDLGEDFIVVINPYTGEAKKVIQTERTVSGRGISFAGFCPSLYLIEGNTLSTINIETGEITLVGTIGDYSSVSLDYDPFKRVFYALSGDDLITIDPATAATTLEAPSLGISACTLVRSFRGSWYTVDNSTKDLLEIDITNGSVTVIGSLGDDASASICGTAFRKNIRWHRRFHKWGYRYYRQFHHCHFRKKKR